MFGLAVSLMFVILIGLYAWHEFSVDRQHGKADRIYAVGLKLKDEPKPRAGSHHAVLRYMKKQYPEIEQTCGFTCGRLRLLDRGDILNPDVLMSDSTFFSMFDFKLLRGDRKTCLNQRNNIVLTESFARRMFGTDDVIGRPIMTEDSLHFRVTGVVQDFDGTIIGKDVCAIVDFSYCNLMGNAYSDENFPMSIAIGSTMAFVQVRKGTDFMQKEKDVQKFFPTFWPGPEDGYTQVSPVLIPLDKLYFSGCDNLYYLHLGNFKLVSILAAVAVVILLFSIMNYINLTVAQSGYRAREMATRRLFGCTKAGVGTNMFGESLVMCLLSLVIAIALAYVFAPYIGRLLDTKISLAPLFSPLGIAVLAAFVIVVSLIAGVLPATILYKVKPIEVVRGTFRKQTKMVFSRVFITVQNVITIVMLACAFIMARQMLHLTKAPLGFNTKNIIALKLNNATDNDFTDRFIDRLRTLPFVKAVAPSYGTPVDGGNNPSVQFDGDKDKSTFNVITGTPEMMKIYGIKMKNNLNLKGDSIVYLNGKSLYFLKMSPNSTHTSDRYNALIPLLLNGNARYGGIINDFNVHDIRNYTQGLILQTCKNITWPRNISILVEGNPTEAYAKIKDIYKEVYHEDVDESTPPFIDKQIEQRFEQELRASKIVSLFALVAIVISLLGLVAMSTYFIQQRAKEIAIRKVFGSTSDQVRRRLIRTFLLYVGIAFVIAVPIIVHFMSDWISQYSYRIVWWPWIIVAGVIVLLISFAAVAVQSWIAAGENPVKNIKQE